MARLAIIFVSLAAVAAILLIAGPDFPGPSRDRDAPQVNAPSDREPVVVPSTAGGSVVAGRVLSIAGDPVEGAAVQLRGSPWAEEVAVRETGTDEEGRFALEAVPSGLWTLRAHAEGFGSGRAALVATDGAEPTEVEIVLDRPTGVIAGVVLDHAGRPAAGVTVAVRIPHPVTDLMAAVGVDLADGSDRFLDISQATDGEGRFRITGALRGTLLLAAGDARLGRAVLRVEVPSAGHVLRLSGAGEVRGVLRRSGAARPASVSIRLAPGGRTVTLEVEDDEATFAVPCVLPGQYVAEITAREFRGLTTKPFEVRPLETVDLGLLTLLAAPRVRGRILDPSGRSIPHAEIELARVREGAIHRSGFVAADGEGRYEVRLEPGRWRLEPGCRGYAVPEGAPVEIDVGEDGVERDLVLEPLPAITGRVVDGDDRPVEGIRVHAGGPVMNSGERRFGRAPGLEEHEDPQTDRTGSDGRFVLYRLLEGESYHITAVDDGGVPVGPFRGLRFDEQARSRPLVFRIAPRRERAAGATILCRILDDAGRPVPGAVVAAGGSLGIAGPEGRCRMENVRQGGVLRLAADGFAVAVRPGAEGLTDGEVDLGDIVLPRESRVAVRGRVLSSDGSGVRAQVIASFTLEDGTVVTRSGETDAEGRYRVAGPDTSSIDVSVRVWANGYEPPGALGATCRPEAFLDFTLVARTRLRGSVSFAGETPRTIRVTGLSTDGDGSYGGWLRFDPARRTWTSDFRPGTWRLLVDAEGYAPVLTEPIVLPEGAAVEVPAVHLTRGGTVEGVLRNADGSAAAEADVVILAHRRGQTTTTDAEGRFRIENVPPGRREIRGWIRDPRRMLSTTIGVTEDATVAVELRP